MKYSKIFVLILVTVLVNGEPIRETQYGQIRGKVTSRLPGIEVEEFLGIPYAAPPTGKLRFQRTREPVPWKPEILETISIKSACPTIILDYIHVHKPDFNMISEDCLYLNLYLPRVTTKNNLPVLLFIHGGDNADGMGAMFDGDLLAAKGQIIVITMNYRVGVLGFYANPSLGIPGNNGLFDQVKAMEWVQNNIRFFNGDPSRVTIHGHSAGAGDVGLHLISNITKGLFQNAIIHSGSPLAHWMMSSCVRTSRVSSVDPSCVAGYSDSRKDLHDKIKKHLLTESGQIQDFFDSIFYGEDVFKVVVDGEYLTDSPDKLFQCQPPHVDSVLFMVAKDEGFEPRLSKIVQYYKNKDIEVIVGRYSHMFNKCFENDIRNVYDLWKTKNISKFPHYLHMVADLHFFIPMIKLADELSNWIQKVYFLTFDYISENIHSDWIGVQHGWDLFYVFGVPLVGHTNVEYTDRDATVSMGTMRLISHFVKTGNLSFNVSDTDADTYNPTLKSYHKLLYKDGKTVLSPGVDFRRARINFWYKYLYPYDKFNCNLRNNSDCFPTNTSDCNYVQECNQGNLFSLSKLLFTFVLLFILLHK